MASGSQGLRVTSVCSSCLKKRPSLLATINSRSFSHSHSSQHPEATRETPTKSQSHASSVPSEFDLKYAHTKLQLRKAAESKTPLVGSLRYRWARSTNQGIPFEQLPYQCFQDARKILAGNRNEVLAKIEMMRGRIARLTEKPATTPSEINSKNSSLVLMRKQLEEYKIEADINDPLVKKKFEDGTGDMNKPIYRHLANKKWREYRRVLVMQRITQMSVVPDVLPNIDPIAAVDISFPGAKVQPGDFVESIHSQHPPILNVQVFDAGPRLVSVVVIDSDVPDFEKDAFTHRCHGAYCNIEISPTSGKIDLADFVGRKESEALSWYPPYALKGSPYHRLSVFVLEQPNNKAISASQLAAKCQRDGVNMRNVVARNPPQKPVGVTMFRTQWDEGTAEVMRQHKISGTEIQMKRAPAEAAPYKKRDTRRMRG